MLRCLILFCTFVPFAQQLAAPYNVVINKIVILSLLLIIVVVVVINVVVVGATLSPRNKRKRNHHDQPRSWPHIDRFLSASIFAFSG